MPDTCKWDFYPDGHRCPRAPAPSSGPTGPGRDYCEQADGPGEPAHNPANAWRARQRLRAAAQAGLVADTGPGQPAPTMTTARLTGIELLQSARVHADRLEAIGIALREALALATDPAAAEAEIKQIRAAADQMVEAADQRAREAEQRATDAAEFAEAANAAAEQMSEDMDAAQTAAAAADTAREEADQRAATAREEADQQVSAIREETERAIEQARAGAAELVREAQDERAQAVQAAAQAGEAASQAQQAAAVATAEARATREELARYRADVEKMLGRLRADAEREREQIRTDLTGRAKRAEDEADLLRRELAELRAAAAKDTTSAGSGPAARPGGRRRAPARPGKDQA
jgi:colicin import membrane protein